MNSSCRARVTRLLVATVLIAAAPVFVSSTAPGSAYADSCVGEVDSDFNGDGVKDIAIGDAFGVVGGVSAGKVEVRYGGTDLVQEVSQASSGVPGTPEEHDMFGRALASYDYNGDGCSDLVVGAPEESMGDKESAGMVTVIPGGAASRGLFTGGAFTVDQDTPGVPGGVEQNDRFGSALAAGRTRSGEPFLAIGVPDEKIGAIQSAGAVHYLRGDLNVMIHQDTPGVPGANETSDDFGATMVATRDHLVVGSSTEDLVQNGRNREDAGAIHVFDHGFGSTGSPRWARMIHQDTQGVSGTPETGDGFGGGDTGTSGEGGLSATAYRPAGVSEQDAGSLIAVGVPGEDFGAVDSNRGEGTVHLFYVSRSGAFRQMWNLHQDTPGVAGGSEPVDLFGDEVLLLGNRADEATTPATTRLLVAVPDERANDGYGAFQLFSLAGAPGDGDSWIGNGTFGLSYPEGGLGAEMGITETDLYLQGPYHWEITVVPWANILDGGSQPVGGIRSVKEGTGGFYGIAMQ